VVAELSEAAAFMDANGFSTTIGKRVATLEARKAELTVKLKDAQEKAANPLSEKWGEAKSLLEAMEQAPDQADARLRLRSALRRIVDGIWLLVVPTGHDRVAAVQIHFAGGAERRDYLILHRPPKANKSRRVEGGSWCWSLRSVIEPGDLDMRRREDAAALEAELLELDLARLTAEVPGGNTAG
jgi:hypothetical protein